MSKQKYPSIKHSFLILIVFMLFPNSIFSQDTEITNEYKTSRFFYNFAYFTFPLSADIGYEYRNNSSELFFPMLGLSYDYGLYVITLYANAKMEYRYKRFFFEIGFKQGLIPEAGDGYKYKKYLMNYLL